MVIINVSGTASHQAPAERCIVSLSVSQEGESQSGCYDTVSSTSNELSTSLKQLVGTAKSSEGPSNAALTEWSMSKLSTSSWLPYHDQSGGEAKPKRQYKVQTGFSITFRNFAALGEHCLEWSKTECISIDNLSWQLTDETTASHQRDVRRSAMQDASTQAKDYASALDLPNASLVCKELNDGARDGHAPVHKRMMAMRAGGSMGGGQAIDFEPGNVEISATVYCTFDYL